MRSNSCRHWSTLTDKARSAILRVRYVILTKVDKHAKEMMTTAEVSEFLMVPFSYNHTKR